MAFGKKKKQEEEKETPFDALLGEVAKRIDGEIEASKDDASRTWSLVTIKKGLKGL